MKHKEMKLKFKQIIMASPAVLLLLAGCMEKESELRSQGAELTAQLEIGEDTRVSLAGSDGKFSWNTGDKIAVYVVGEGDYVKNIPVDPATGAFSLNGVRDRYAVYPSDAADSDNTGSPTLKVKLPATYDISDIVADAGNSSDIYRPGAEYSPVPMVAVNDPLQDILYFRHVGALLRYKWVNLPAGTKTVTVTFDTDVTGTYAVDLTDSSAPTISSAGTSSNNVVTFTVSASGLSDAKTVLLNVPVPCGHYGSVSLQAFNEGGSSLAGPFTYTDGPQVSLVFGRHRGRMLVSGDSFIYHLNGLLDITTGYTGGEKPVSTSFVSYKVSPDGTKVAVPFHFEYSETSASGPWSTAKPDWLNYDSALDFGGTTSERSIHVGITPQDNLAHDPHADNLYSATERGTSSNPYDLSRVDVSTSNQGAQNVNKSTANCYVVQAAGYYTFPLEYGNTYDNNKFDSDSYYGRNGTGAQRPEGGETRAENPTIPDFGLTKPIRFLGRFRDHLDQWTTSPHIYEQHAGKTLSAGLLWTDVEGLIDDVHISSDGHSIVFHVPHDKDILCQGNAVVAVFADGKIAWSWHIWVTDRDLRAKDGPSGTKFLPFNVGWCDSKELENYPERKRYVRAVQEGGNTTEAVLIQSQAGPMVTIGGNNPFYQWGRKDPLQAIYMLTRNNNRPVLTEKPYYPTSAEYAQQAVETQRDTLIGGTNSLIGGIELGEAIQHPYIFYYSSADMNNRVWSRKITYNLWDSHFNQLDQALAYSYSHATAHKTIYDPSPVGYRVPCPIDYSSFTTSNTAPKTVGYDQGIAYNDDLFFPSIGYRSEYGSFSSAYSVAWTSVPLLSGSSYYEYFGLLHSPMEFNVKDIRYPAGGYSVHPVTGR